MATQYLALPSGGATWAPVDLTTLRQLAAGARTMKLTGGRMTAVLVSSLATADTVYSWDGTGGGRWTTSAYPP